MNKALPFTAVSLESHSRGGRGVLSGLIWLGVPLLIGASVAAASWGQLTWWPSALLGCLFAVHCLSARQIQSLASGFRWEQVTQVEVVADLSRLGHTSLCFVIWAGERQARISGEEAVARRLLSSMSDQLGDLDQAQLLKALGCQGDGRFTVWRRADNAGLQN